MPAPGLARHPPPPYRSPVRLRRLRSGTLSAVRLRRRPDDPWPHTGLRDREPPPRPEPVTDCPGPPACDLDAPHRHLDLSPPAVTRPDPAEGRPLLGMSREEQRDALAAIGIRLTDPPERPHPAANAWPDDAVTVTYGELRRLVALHLDLAWQGMPNAEPWLWIRHRAKAMRDGESPLLIAEVMEP
jgi:hypothetical protein